LSEEFYNEAHRAYLHLFEGNVNYAQISPRHFEAAATRSAQVLYDGYYSGIFIPNRHFIPLRRDLKNFDEVVDFIADDRKTSEIVNCAFEEIILNRQFHYENFVEQLDEVLAQALARKGRKASGASVAVNSPGDRRALLLAAHEPTIDPRIEWMAEGLSADFAVCELGTFPDTSDASTPSCEELSDCRMRVRIGRYRHDWDILPDVLKMGAQSSLGFQHLTLLHVLAELPTKALERSIGALGATEQDLNRFRGYARYFVHTNSALLQAARLIGEFDAIVAADLETLPAALVLADESGATVLYDAHEFWPHSAIEFRHWEVEFWSAFDRNLAARADLRSTVSPQLAALLSREYGCEFLSVPNCASRSSVPAVDTQEALQRLSAQDDIVFIFVGRFAAGRGLEDLIRAWGGVNKRARLVLQGPDDPFKSEMMELARSYGLLENGITFPKPVDTSELVNAARQGDIAIIPYAASSVNNRYCSPNKLSQYMAAGLPIICNNELEFVKSVVVGNGIGIAVDFQDPQALAEVVNRLVTSTDEIGEMALRSQRFFDSDFNWEMVSGDLYARLRAAVADKASSARPGLDFSWIEHGREMRRPAAEIGDAPSPCSEVARAAYAEVKRLNEIYPAEITRLHEVYSIEIKRLNDVIGLIRIALRPVRIALRQVRRAQRLLTMKRVRRQMP
jgi:glycosyltransferase involved in cell wall biosynthesis